MVSASVRVSNLLLLAGADPSCRTLGSTPGTSLLGAHCRLGNTEMVALLLEWGASVDTSTGGTTDHCTMEKDADKLEFLIKALWIAHFREWIAQL